MKNAPFRKSKTLAARAAMLGMAVAGGVTAATLPAHAAGAAQATGGARTAGAVYTMTNSAGGNAIEAYARAADGA
jgi:hypothetical protein